MNETKRITDPIHGSVLLTSLEADIVASKAFQRLHNVRQLGLAYYVFPAANYSRFSHSLGACHNAAKMISAIKRTGPADVTSKAKEYELKLRLGALLHDLGHYPFSHATEHVVGNYYSEQKLLSSASNSPVSGVSLNHEDLGEFVLRNDPELCEIFQKHSLEVGEVLKVFNKADPDNTLVEIISSDLDCDRLDYLRRTSHHTGLPYGSVDTDFLVSQACLDGDHRFGYKLKAARAADHLLVSRYYDYLQVPYNKTVSALEWSLVTCIENLLREGQIDCTTTYINSQIQQGRWGDFDDNYFFVKFRDRYRSCAEGDCLKDHFRAILERSPAKTIYSHQSLIEVGKTGTQKDAEMRIGAYVKTKGIDPGRIKVWPIDVKFAKYRRDDVEQTGAVRIVFEDGTSKLLCSMPDMLFSKLIDLSYKGYRVFYLPSGAEGESDVKSIEQEVADAMKEINS